MNRGKILVFGASGMAGHIITYYFEEINFDVTTFTINEFKHKGKNIIGNAFDSLLVSKIINEGDYDAIINCIGLLKEDSEKKKPEAIYLNSYFPYFLSDITKNSKTKIIQMSTDCVFSGKTGGYNEESFKDGPSFYDRTKALGELDNNKDLTFRNSIIGPDMNKNGLGLFNWFMSQEKEITGFKEVIWTGVTTLTLAKAMVKAIDYNLSGIYNLVNNNIISKYELLVLFNNYFKEGKIIIKEDSSLEINKSLINTRKDFNFIVPGYEDMIKEMKEWLNAHKNLYSHYLN